jgi:hypothetical protein
VEKFFGFITTLFGPRSIEADLAIVVFFVTAFYALIEELDVAATQWRVIETVLGADHRNCIATTPRVSRMRSEKGSSRSELTPRS